MTHFCSLLHSAAVCLGSASLVLTFSSAANAQEVIATDPVGYIAMTVPGGTRANPGAGYFSPALVNPVEWQGQVIAVSGSTLTLASADWPADLWDARYCLEVVTGPNAGIWSAIVSAVGNQLTLAEMMEDILVGNETVRIRRFTTLSDFLGAENEAGLASGDEIAFSDSLTVYHVSGTKIYWYYSGSAGGSAGWLDASWNRADDAIIAPGEGVVLRRRTDAPLPVYQVGTVRTGSHSLVVNSQRNMLGGIAPVDLSLGDSSLYTGDSSTGIASGGEPAFADGIVIYGNPTNTYWYYDGSYGGAAGWMDASWNRADDVTIPGGATFVINRRSEGPFVWFLPSLVY